MVPIGATTAGAITELEEKTMGARTGAPQSLSPSRPPPVAPRLLTAAAPASTAQDAAPAPRQTYYWLA